MLRSGNEELIREKLVDGLKSYYLEVEKVQAEIKVEAGKLEDIKVSAQTMLKLKEHAAQAVSEAQDGIRVAAENAKKLEEEATLLISQKIKDSLAKIEAEERELEALAKLLDEKASALVDKESALRIKSDELGEREANLIKAEEDVNTRLAQIQISRERLDAGLKTLAQHDANLVSREAELKVALEGIALKQEEQTAEASHLRTERVRLEALDSKLLFTLAGLRDLDVEKEAFKVLQAEYQDLRDKQLAREISLNEYEARLEVDQEDLLEREKLSNVKISRGE